VRVFIQPARAMPGARNSSTPGKPVRYSFDAKAGSVYLGGLNSRNMHTRVVLLDLRRVPRQQVIEENLERMKTKLEEKLAARRIYLTPKAIAWRFWRRRTCIGLFKLTRASSRAVGRGKKVFDNRRISQSNFQNLEGAAVGASELGVCERARQDRTGISCRKGLECRPSIARAPERSHLCSLCKR